MGVKLFDSLNVANLTVNVIPKTTVIPLGNTIGLKLYTEGVLVVGMSEIEGEKPYENTGITEGDRIIKIDKEKISNTEELVQTVNSSQGKEVQITYIKEDTNEEKVANILPAKTKDNEYKLGLWVRDAAAGVGTLTFYEPDSKMFAALGHGITDIDTGSLVTIANGELVNSNIVSITKGEYGNTGEIRGSYQIEIQKIYTANNRDNKSMLIKVTDKELLEKTGGIIQGMSGSPIIQNGKFVGAVTHVLVNDPTTGYAVFADMMLKQMKTT